MQTISLCMIVKNEESHLIRCLNSVQNLVDEIIIVDTGSTDFTKEIARRYTEKIYSFEWTNDFSAARNFCIEHATGDYILVLDADEYLDTQNLQSITETDFDYYMFRFKNFMPDGEVVFHQAIRMFKNRSDIRYKGRIHENILTEGLQLEGAVSDTIIYHDGYLEKVYKEKEKHRRNTDLLKMQLDSEPRGFDWFNLGKQHMIAAEFQDALGCFKQAYYLSKEAVYLPYLLLCMAECLHQLGQFNEGVQLVNDIIPLYPDYTDLYLLQGKLYNRLGYYLDAEQSFLTCLQLGDMGAQVLWTSREGAGGYIARLQLADTYLQMGKLTEAFDQIHLVIQDKEHIQHSLPALLQLAAQARLPEDEVMQFLERVYPIETPTETKIILEILFQCRSSLLEKYIQKYFVRVNGIVKAVANQYSGKYEAAKSMWMLEKTRPVQDLLLLALVLEDGLVLEQCVKASKDAALDWEPFRNLVAGKNASVSLTLSHEALLLQTAELLIRLREFPTIERVLDFLHHSKSFSLKISIMKRMIQYGYTSQILSVLERYMKDDGNMLDYLKLLAEAEIRENRLDQAISLLEQLAGENRGYDMYQTMYLIYEQKDDRTGMERIRGKIAEQYANSMWGQKILV